MRLPGRILIIVGVALTALAALLCIIGLAAPGWTGGQNIFCGDANICHKSTAALSVISFILLIVSVISLGALIFNLLKGSLQIVPVIILFVATIFLLGTVASFVTPGSRYSFSLMVASLFFSYAALAIAAFWLGQSSTESTTG